MRVDLDEVHDTACRGTNASWCSEHLSEQSCKESCSKETGKLCQWTGWVQDFIRSCSYIDAAPSHGLPRVSGCPTPL